jgi:hypothetical protein
MPVAIALPWRNAVYAPGRKGNQNRSLEMIRRSQSRRLNLRLLGGSNCR